MGSAHHLTCNNKEKSRNYYIKIVIRKKKERDLTYYMALDEVSLTLILAKLLGVPHSYGYKFGHPIIISYPGIRQPPAIHITIKFSWFNNSATHWKLKPLFKYFASSKTQITWHSCCFIFYKHTHDRPTYCSNVWCAKMTERGQTF